MSNDYDDYVDGAWTPAPGALHENQVIIQPPRGSNLRDGVPSIEHGAGRDDPDYDRAGTPGLREVFIMNIQSGPISRGDRDR